MNRIRTYSSSIESPLAGNVRAIRTPTEGFTLLELLIAVAIIGLLASVAVGAYQGYINDTRSAQVLRHFDEAEAYAGTRFLQAHTALSVSADPSFPTSAVQWIDEINPTDANAPSGGPAYIAGAGNPLTGAIGVQYSGTFEDGDAALVLNRPAYSGVAASSVTITY